MVLGPLEVVFPLSSAPLLFFASASAALLVQPINDDRQNDNQFSQAGVPLYLAGSEPIADLADAKTHAQSGRKYMEQGKFDKAEELFSKALVILEKRLGNEHEQSLSVANELAVTKIRQGQYEEAERALLHVNAVRERLLGDQHPDFLKSHNDLAILNQAQGRYSEAEEKFSKVLRHRERNFGPDHADVLKTLNDLGVLFYVQGRYRESETLSHRALAGRKRVLGPDHRDTLGSMNNLAVLFYELGRYDEVEPLFLHVLDARERRLGPEHPLTLGSVNNLAVLYYDLERFEEVEPLFLRALSIRRRTLGEEHPSTLDSINNLAALYKELDRLAEAESLVLQTLDARQRILGMEHPSTLVSAHDLAVLYRDQGRFDAAELLFIRVISGKTKRLGMNHVDVSETLSDLGSLQIKQGGDRATGIFFMKKAVNILQEIRQNFSDPDQKSQQALVDKWRDIYERLLQALIAEGRFAEAELVGRMIKETEYRSYIRSSNEQGRGESLFLNQQEAAWNAQLDEWISRPNLLNSKMEQLQNKRRGGGQLTDLEQRQLEDLADAYDSSYAEFRTTVSGWLDDVRAKDDEQIQEEARALELAASERLQGVIANIGPDVALLQLVAFEDTLHMFLITPGAFKHVGVPIQRSNLFEKIYSARQTIDKGNNPAIGKSERHRAELMSRLGELYDWLIRPIEDDLSDAGTKTLMLNVQGEIRYTPFAALWDGNAWLVERLELAVYTPAAQTRFETPAAVDRARAFGLSAATEGFSELPAVEDELMLIVGDDSTNGVVDGSFSLNQEFTRDSLENSLVEPAPILHIASHFAIRPGNEASSFLVLGDGSHLSIAEISRSSRLRFRGVELLTLSACETAIGGKGLGMEIEGIGALAQNKGAASVIATLWPVSDDSTPLLMRDFYDGLANGKLNKAAALQRAQMAKINSSDFDHPFFWAPFIIMGNWK